MNPTDRDRPFRPAILAAILALVLLPACDPRQSGRGSVERGELLVSAAVSLAPALREAAAAYEATQPGSRIRINAGASGILMQQIRRGAPVDLFLSAASDELDRLTEEGRIDRDASVVLAGNRLVLITARDAPEPPAGPARPEGFASIALANPRTAPLGRYTQEALMSRGLWELVSARAIWGEDARQVAEYVARGDVEAGIVYLSDASTLADRVRRGPLLDADSHTSVLYRGAILRDARNPGLAADFLRFLRSAPAQDALARHGFSAAPG